MLAFRTPAIVIVLTLLPLTITQAQEPVPPVTLWRYLGMPQGLNALRDTFTNRRGNHPGLERKPPMKRIGDPANLKSDNPAIKAAAEIKQAEDSKEQKIKAIKYLAKIGCGCYDKDGKITEALLAATDDCTPDVRLASIEAIGDAAGDECCKKCGSTSCCNEKISKKLSDIAYERDDSGCPLEPNQEVREAAARALRICCPGRLSGPIEEAAPLEEINKGTEEIGGERKDGKTEIEGESTRQDVEGDAEELKAPNVQAARQPRVYREFEMIDDYRLKSAGSQSVVLEISDEADSIRFSSEQVKVVAAPFSPRVNLTSAPAEPIRLQESVNMEVLSPVNRIPLPIRKFVAPINAPEPVKKIPLPLLDGAGASIAPTAKN